MKTSNIIIIVVIGLLVNGMVYFLYFKPRADSAMELTSEVEQLRAYQVRTSIEKEPRGITTPISRIRRPGVISTPIVKLDGEIDVPYDPVYDEMGIPYEEIGAYLVQEISLVEVRATVVKNPYAFGYERNLVYTSSPVEMGFLLAANTKGFDEITFFSSATTNEEYSIQSTRGMSPREQDNDTQNIVFDYYARQTENTNKQEVSVAAINVTMSKAIASYLRGIQQYIGVDGSTDGTDGYVGVEEDFFTYQAR